MEIEDPRRERRHHRAIVTEHTEYHLHDELCVAVRERQTGRWRRDHPAVGGRLERPGGDWCTTSAQLLGTRAYFVVGYDRRLATSPVREVVRPDREAVSHYANHACADTATLAARPSR